MKKVLLTVLVILVVFIAGAISYIKFALPNVQAAPNISINKTTDRVAHGEYLANHVTVCMDCHSTRDWNKFAGPVTPGTLGKGGEYFNEDVGFPGKFYSKNITPDHLLNWTDGDIYRAITTGVSKNGDPLFPVMPYSYYGRMDKEDIYDIIAYVRSLKPIQNVTPAHVVDFPMNFILNTIPKDEDPHPKPPKTDTLKYGAYIVKAAACIECHTPVKRGQIIEDKAFTGGREFVMPNGIVRSANITPDLATGIGSWTPEIFMARFKAYSNPDNLPVLAKNEVNTIMPWTMYAGMDSTDLVAIYKYLVSLKPVKNKVEHFEAKKGK
ncbi:MAG: cytochrome C [Ginsengibacter sp.]